jgi:flagellar biosynthesis regulator FlaF
MQKVELALNKLKINNIEDDNTPLLLRKKSKKRVIKSLTHIRSDTGKIRHFTPAAQEWFNSIYAYNKNYIKTLSIADKNLMYLLKSYFNSQIKDKLIHVNSRNKKKKSILPRFRRLSLKKIFLGKGELKHTSSRVIITFYVYNTESMFLMHKIMQFKHGLFYIPNYVNLKKTVTSDHEGNIKISYNRPFSFEEYKRSRQLYERYLTYMIRIVKKNTARLNAMNKLYKNLKSLVWAKFLTNDERYLIFKNNVEPNYTNYMSFTNYVLESGENYKKNLPLNRTLLHFNNLKFDGGFISKLIDLVKQVYNKKVEFNIVNLKKMHLNSDVYTQAVSLKLKNRDNKLYRVLKASLRKIKLPVIKKIDEIQKKPNRDEFLVNIIRNNTISTMLKRIKKNKIRNDNLNKLLLKFYPLADNLNLNVIKKPFSIIRSFSLEDYVLRSLKHLNLRGIRVEAKGRLTRRFTASRSVSKLRCKGGLKNVDSSFRGLSTIMLRGIVKSNLQYSTINSKNRNGAFGIKAWVSSK